MTDSEDYSKRALAGHVETLLDGALGALPRELAYIGVTRLVRHGRPVQTGLNVLAVYGVAFVALPYLVLGLVGRAPEPHIFWLQVYASLYLAWAAGAAAATSAGILDRITNKIIPALSAETCRRIDDDLAERFAPRRIWLNGWILALAGTLIAALALRLDIGGEGSGPVVQLLWWSPAWLLILLTAIRVTDVARFYFVFAEHLKDDPEALFAEDPKNSRLVTDVGKIGRTVLMFWLGIAVSIPFLIPFANLGDDTFLCRAGDLPRVISHLKQYYAEPADVEHLFYPPNSLFFAGIALAFFPFSIPFGTMVFLSSEVAIRRAVDDVLYARLRTLERQITALEMRPVRLGVEERQQLEEMKAAHSELAASGAYTNLLASALGVALPFVGPAITLIAGLFKSAHHHAPH
jgi:hypothetical protein